MRRNNSNCVPRISPTGFCVLTASEKISFSTSGFGKMRALRLNARVGDARLDQVLGVVAVEDGEIAPVAQRFGVACAECARRWNGTCRPRAPTNCWPSKSATRRIISPAALLVNVSSRILFCGNPLFQQEGDAVHQRACLARTGAGNDQGGAGRGSYGGVLLRVEFARVINLRMKIRLEILQNILARHGRKLKREKTRKKSEKEGF